MNLRTDLSQTADQIGSDLGRHARHNPTRLLAGLSDRLLPGGARQGGGTQNSSAVTISQVSKAWLYGLSVLLTSGALLRSKPLFGLGIVLAVALGVAWLWARWSLHNLKVERRFSQPRAFYGEEVDMAQVFTNAKPLPVPWLAVDDEIPGELAIVESESNYTSAARIKRLNTSLSLGWYERVTRHYRLLCTARGEHEFGPVDLRSGDVFGFFRRAEEVETPGTLLVYPRYLPVEKLDIPARQPFGDYKAAQQLATDPLRIRAVREYAYGDNPRHIHWKATARRGQLQTKLFEPAATPRLFIFCNQDTFARIWEGLDRETLELTITVAASLANHALNEGYMVGLQVNSFNPSSDRQVKLEPSRSPEQFTRILEALARIKGWSGLPIEELLRAERRNLPRGATIVVVTGVVTEDLMSLLFAIRQAGHPVTLVETTATAAGKARGRAQALSPAALRLQGITYYQVDTAGREAGAAELEEIVF